MSKTLIKKKSFWKYKSFFVIPILLLLLISCFFLLSTKIASKNNRPTDITKSTKTTDSEKNIGIKNISVSLKFISNENISSFKINNIAQDATVFDITNANSKMEYNNNYDFGVFVESINDIKNGDDGRYWQYYINDVLGDSAADKKHLNDGDQIEWRFEDISNF